MGGDSAVVMIHAIEARDLKPNNSSGMIDPVLCVETLGEKKFTPKFKQDLAPYFNHYFHIESTKVEDFATARLVISVFDSGTIFRNELIGAFTFELQEVNKQKGHEHFRVWVLLTSPDKNGKDSVRGYLKLSVTVLRPGDEPGKHDDEPEVEEGDDQEEDLSKMVLLKPKGMDGIENILRVKVFKAENLPKMDAIGSCDPFVEVRYGNNTNKTSVLKKVQSPEWYEELQLPVVLPSVADNVVVKVFDFDVGTAPEFIGQKIVSLKEIQTPTPGTKNWTTPSWVNFYNGKGAQGEATDYAGRLLTSFNVSPAEARSAVVKISPEATPTTITYTISFDLYELQGMPKSSNGYYVVVAIGSYKVTSQKKKREGEQGLVEYYESLPDLDTVFPTDTSQVPDIFVYVYESATVGDDKRVGYLRFTHEQFSKLGATPRWEQLKRNHSSKDDENFSGAIQFKGVIATSKPLARVKPVKPTKKPFQLRAHIYLANNLPAGDETALSDPYVSISFGGVKTKTKVHERTTYPEFYETLVLDVDVAEANAPNINISVYDHDKISSDEFLGRAVAPLPKVGPAANIAEPQFYRLSLREQIPGRGEVLASFQLLPADQKSAPLPTLRPRTIEAEVDLGVVGVRDITPYRLIPVTDPYVKFTVTGTNKTLATKKIKGHHGTANFFENIKIPVALPENPIFMPAVQIEVFDKRAFGDVLVGTTALPLVNFAPWVPDNKKPPAASLVDLPPPVKDDKFYQPPVDIPATTTTVATASASGLATGLASGLSAASGIVPAEPKVAVALDIEVGDESTALLGVKGKARVPVVDGSLKEIGMATTRREVQTTTVPGMEDEPEPPAQPELPSELEHSMKSFPFIEVDLYRGTSKFNKPDTVVGKIKGSVAVRATSGPSAKKKDVANVVDVAQLAKPRPFVLRVYVEVGQNLVPHDENGYSDPYLVISTGKQIIKDKENVKKKTLQPEFYKLYQFRGNLPEEHELKVQVYDKDELDADDFMGETKYDLEMLWFSDEWRKKDPKPKEYRTLWSSLSSFPQGKLRMWLELLTPEEAAIHHPYPIAPPTREPYELRIIVWETKNVVPKDKILGKDSSDQFLVFKLLDHPQMVQQTDTHDSVMDGCGKFNWRIVYPDVFLPYTTPRLKIQVFDKDHIGPNDSIAEANLNLKGFFQKGLRNKSAKIGKLTGVAGAAAQTTALTNTVASAAGSSSSKDSGKDTAGPYNTGQWLDLFHPSYEGVQGTVCVELELLTREDALAKAAGRGRSDPNANPFLPEPVRPKREWLGDFMKFFGLDKLKKYLIMAGVALGVILLLIIIIKFA